jgi:hypothetical protein
MARYAEIIKDAIYWRASQPRKDFANLVKRCIYSQKLGWSPTQSFFGFSERVDITINANDSSAWSNSIRNASRMASSSNGSIDIDTAFFKREPFHDFIEKRWPVVLISHFA